MDSGWKIGFKGMGEARLVCSIGLWGMHASHVGVSFFGKPEWAEVRLVEWSGRL